MTWQHTQAVLLYRCRKGTDKTEVTEMNNTEIKRYVEDYAGEFVNDFDIEEVVEEVSYLIYKGESIEDIDLDWILQANDISGK